MSWIFHYHCCYTITAATLTFATAHCHPCHSRKVTAATLSPLVLRYPCFHTTFARVGYQCCCHIVITETATLVPPSVPTLTLPQLSGHHSHSHTFTATKAILLLLLLHYHLCCSHFYCHIVNLKKTILSILRQSHFQRWDSHDVTTAKATPIGRYVYRKLFLIFRYSLFVCQKTIMWHWCTCTIILMRSFVCLLSYSPQINIVKFTAPPVHESTCTLIYIYSPRDIWILNL